MIRGEILRGGGGQVPQPGTGAEPFTCTSLIWMGTKLAVARSNEHPDRQSCKTFWCSDFSVSPEPSQLAPLLAFLEGMGG